MSRYISLVAAVSVLGLIACCSADGDGVKPITAVLDANWRSSPLLLEISEFAASESNASFWSFVDAAVDASIASDKDEYDDGIAILKASLSQLDFDLLRFALSVRFHSPAVQSFQQVAEEHLHDSSAKSCETFATVNGKDYCSVSDLKTALDTATTDGESESTSLYDFDHVYPFTSGAPVTAVVYGRLGTASLREFHALLKPQAKAGAVRYVLRHYVQRDVLEARDPLRMSGYGVELAIKSTEYKAVDDSAVKESDAGSPSMGKDDEDEVEGFLFGVLKKRFPEEHENLRKLRTHLVEGTNEMAPLKVWQLQDLSYQASQRILSSEPTDALRVMRDISQNIPMLARSLSKTRVPREVRSEITSNQKILANYGVDAGSSVFFINGMLLRLDAMDPFRLIALLKSEAKAMHGLSSIGITGDDLQRTLAISVHPTQGGKYGVDMRGDAVQYINNVEGDQEYASFTPYLQQMLYGVPEGHLRRIRKNIFNVIFCVNPVEEQSIRLLRGAQKMLSDLTPVRMGLLFVAGGGGEVDAKQHAGAALTRVYKYVQSNQGGRSALKWLIDFYDSNELPFDASAIYKKVVSEFGEDDAEELFAIDAAEDKMRRLGNRFYQRKGLGAVPRLVINGQIFEVPAGKDVRKSVIEACEGMSQQLQQQIYMGEINDWTNLEERFYTQDNIKKRYNEFVFSKDATVISLTSPLPDASLPSTKLQDDQLTARTVASLRYAHTSDKDSDARVISAFVATDLTLPHGQSMVAAALKQAQRDVHLRATFVHHPSSEASRGAFIAKAVTATLQSQTPSVAAQSIASLMEPGAEKAREEETDFVALAKAVVGFNAAAFETALASTDEHLSLQAQFSQQVLGLVGDQSAVVANGKVLGPLTADSVFVADDFLLLQEFDMAQYATKLQSEMKSVALPELEDGETESHVRSNLMMKAVSALRTLPQRQRYTGLGLKSQHSAMHLETGSGQFSYEIMAIIDPLTESAQRLAPLLQVLQNVTSVDITVFMNPKSKLSELPVKRFYRYVLEPSMEFTKTGSACTSVAAVFSDLPDSILLTLKMDVPQPWMVEVVRSAYDLDNIRLADVEQAVVSTFQLIAIVMEGHCSDIETGSPTRGLQFILGTPSLPDRVDTIVMANMGYFQLKANPGAWGLRLRSGRSQDIFQIEKTSGAEVIKSDDRALVIVNDFNGKFIEVSVRKRPGKEQEDVLEGGGEEEKTGFWGNVLGTGDENYEAETDEVINVFSIASGHLYERFLRIMMLSVVKKTKTPVKFWFLQNFLSPQFKDFIPHMAKEYGFQYELVQYKWPHWLHRQTEKQRIIWGYKILFLDVLFPLNVKRIIYVDADQTVRSDLKELMDMDLEGAPYAYTPFCNSRPEMDGFRFWKSGYWASHLSGLPYHISALYVVDLKRFRRLAAGDRLRGQYQGLSQDPNSLANLDQDLPNNMIHQVRIKSLPQEWLWCETWCSNSTKPNAKTIDLCNNPQTKEPKLSAAMRIIPEWSSYDQEVRSLQDQIDGAPLPPADTPAAGSQGHSHDEF
ncbi:UDP-glucose:glycoprotein glucosyltransferase 1-like [Sycon ciliatum]|uniref:UDP-glucose:glycoprotein glucosyltransferase 1-like n=1 Tax=Sycon ciliatum TaxID=27933 RepID=UPI0020AD0CA0|eukprot:scpid12138/ scgid29005/ UDP-glucose:glycoprotein glucosyltransferase 1; UDP--Glc:glycoprotein glucosyltransferase; UDP-glucose ceramide glucosyltransferase-like 1